MKSIYDYKSFRDFLKDSYLEKKRRIAGFTYATFAEAAGIASPNYLKVVIDGKRGLTPTNIQGFARALGLLGEEVEFFEALVLENQSESTMERRYYKNRIARLKRGAATQMTRRRPSDLIRDVLHLSLQLCAQGRVEEDAITLVMRELEVSRSEAQKALQALKQSGELIVDERALLQPGARHTMMHDPRGISEYQRAFLRGGLSEASKVFDDRYPAGAAKFLSLLLTAPEGSLPGLFADMKSAVEKAAETYDPPSTEVAPGVYRVQFQVYRVRRNCE